MSKSGLFSRRPLSGRWIMKFDKFIAFALSFFLNEVLFVKWNEAFGLTFWYIFWAQLAPKLVFFLFQTPMWRYIMTLNKLIRFLLLSRVKYETMFVKIRARVLHLWLGQSSRPDWLKTSFQVPHPYVHPLSCKLWE